MHDNINLIIKNLSYNKDNNYMTILFNHNDVDKEIIVRLDYDYIENDVIKGLSSEELQEFLMNFMYIKNRREFLNKFFKTIFDYAENQDSVKFPVRII